MPIKIKNKQMKFLKKIRLENLKSALQEAYRRMPVSILLIIVTFGLFLTLINGNFTDATKNIIHKTVFTAILTFFLSVGIYLFYEAGNFSKKNKWVLQINSFIFAGLFYYFFEENLLDIFSTEVFVYITVTLVGIFSFVYIAPFLQSWLKKGQNQASAQQEFFNFASLLTLKTLMSVIVGVVVMLLGFAGLAALFALFDLSVNEGDWFSTWTAFSLSLVAPIFFLINLPTNDERKNTFAESKFAYFLVNYLGLSAITIYFVILYAYSIKVLLNFSEWPRGRISWLVIGFSSFGYLIYFAVYNFSKKFKPAKIFQKLFPILVLPQVVMLFYAIFLRINQHDWTINRYLVMAFGVWLAVISLYYIFSQKKYLSFIPVSMMFFVLAISLSGPASIYIFPKHRQQDKLLTNLKKAEILQNEKIIPLKNYYDIDRKLSGEIYGSIQYLCKFHGCQSLDFVFKEMIEAIKKQDKQDFAKRKLKNKYMKDAKYQEIRSWALVSKLTDKIKVAPYYSKDTDPVPEFIFFNVNDDERYKINREIKVSGYDLLVYINGDVKASDLEKRFGFKIDLTKIIKKLTERFKNGEFNSTNRWDRYNFEVKPEDLTFDFETEKYFVKVQLDFLTIKNPEWKPEYKEPKNKFVRPIPENEPISGYILLKNKN